MFDIAWSELLLIAVVALIFIGPKELPAVLHKLGQDDCEAEAVRRRIPPPIRGFHARGGLRDLQKNIQDLRSLNPANQLRSTIEGAINQNYMPKPAAHRGAGCGPAANVAITPQTSSASGSRLARMLSPPRQLPKLPLKARRRRGQKPQNFGRAGQGTERPVDAPPKNMLRR